MSLTTIIRRLMGRPEFIGRDQQQRLKRLPLDQRNKEFCAILYRHCEKRATDFVKEELQRGESPYQGISAALFFHEMLAVTLWIMDKKLTNGKLQLMDELHDHYFRAYTALDCTVDERHAALLKKYKGYDDTWNEITGHLDEFGLKVVQNLYGKEENVRTRERTFWIIHYADDTAKAFFPYKKVRKELDLKSAPEKATV